MNLGFRRFFSRSLMVVFGALAWTLASCGSRELKIDIQPKYSDIQRIVISQKCVHCHSSLATYSGVMQIVEAGNAEESDLYSEVADGGMPIQTAPLSDKEVKAIRDWINAGAQNN